MTLPSSEPPGLGVGPDKIRRWQGRGLIGQPDSPAQAFRPNVVTSQTTGRQDLGAFPPIVEVWLPSTKVEPAEERSVD
jgi:hypothetical protein